MATLLETYYSQKAQVQGKAIAVTPAAATSPGGGIYQQYQQQKQQVITAPKPIAIPVEPVTISQPAPSIFQKAKTTISSLLGNIQVPQVEKVKDFLLETREFLNKEVGKIQLVKPAYAPAKEYAIETLPTGEKIEQKTLEQLVGEYVLSPLYEKNRKTNIFIGNLSQALTGGIIKPQMEAPKNVSEQVVATTGSILGAVVSLRTISKLVGGLITKPAAVGKFIDQYPKLAKYLLPLVETTATFNIYGQLDPDLKDRLRQVKRDTLLAVPFSLIGVIKPAKFAVPASFGLGFGLAKLDGANDTEAFISGTILALLSAAGRLKGDTISKKVADRTLKNESLDILSKSSGIKLGKDPTQAKIRKAYLGAVKKYHPDVAGGDEKIFKTIVSAYEFLTGKTISPTFYERPAEAEVKPSEKAVVPAKPPIEKPAVKPPVVKPVVPKAPMEKAITKWNETFVNNYKDIQGVEPALEQISKMREEVIKAGNLLDEESAKRAAFNLVKREGIKISPTALQQEIEREAKLTPKQKARTAQRQLDRMIKNYQELVLPQQTTGSQYNYLKEIEKLATKEGLTIPDFVKQHIRIHEEPTIKPPVEKPPVEIPTEIPKELESLAREARKYKSFKEFVRADYLKKVVSETLGKQDIYAYKDIRDWAGKTENMEALEDFYTQATKGVEPKGVKEYKLTYPELKRLPQTKITEIVSKQGWYSGEIEQRIEKGKLSKGDLDRLGIVLKHTDIKNLLRYSPEFKAKPILTFTKDKVLAFKGKKQKFSIFPEAMGLKSSDFKEGDIVNLEGFETKGQIPLLKKQKGVPGGYGDVGGYANVESMEKSLKNIRAVEFPELLRIVQKATSETPTLKKFRIALGHFYAKNKGMIKLDPDAFKDPVLTAKVMAHEIGHLTDWLEDKTMARGNLVGRIASLNNHLKNLYGDLENKAIREELKELTQIWKPFDETKVPESYTKYRYSSRELYADSISVLFNDPDLLRKTAPHFWDGFFEYLDRKPTVKKLFFETQDLLNQGEEAIFAERDRTMNEAYKKAEETFYAKQLEKSTRKFDLLQKIRLLVDDKNIAVNKAVVQQMKKGVKLEVRKNPMYELAGLNYTEGKLKNYVKKYFQPVLDKANEIESEDGWNLVGKVLFLERIAYERGATRNPVGYLREFLGDGWGDIARFLPSNIEAKGASQQLEIMEERLGRYQSSLVEGGTLWDEVSALLPKSIANPFGYDMEIAKQQLVMLEKNTPKEDWVRVRESVRIFREAMDEIVNRAEQNEFYSPELIKEMKANPAYATFQVIDYLDTYVSSRTYRQVGTLKDIANPGTTSLMKAVSVLQAIERNNAKKVTLDFFKKHYPEEIQLAKSRWTGRYREFLEPKAKEMGLVVVIEEGKPQGYYVAKEIADTLGGADNRTVRITAELIRKLTFSPIYRKVFTGINVGFFSFNFVRDFNRYWLNTPHFSLTERMIASLPVIGKVKPAFRYLQAFPHARKRIKGEYSQLVEEMQELKAIGGMTFYEFWGSPDPKDTQVERILRQTGVLKLEKRRNLLTKVDNVLETVGNWGDFIESMPKIAAYIELKDKMPVDELAHFIRTKAGSPDFRTSGLLTPATNNLFIFSNAWKEGWKTDLSTVFTKPKTKAEKATRSGYVWKQIMSAVLPAIVGVLIGLGYFGKKLKEIYDGASEYDKTNYQIIPIGLDENGKSIYMRGVMDEIQRFIHGFTRKVVLFAARKELKGLASLFDYGAGQLPGLTPSIELWGVLATYLSGKNPYDSFRGRYVIPETAFRAGYKESFPYLFDWIVKNQGAGIIVPQFKLEGENITSLQRFLNLPVVSNIIGRWIKVSDYGKTEEVRDISEMIRSEKAKESVAKNKKVQEATKEYFAGGKTYTDEARIEQNLVDEVFGDSQYEKDKKAGVTNLRKQFRIEIHLKGKQDPNINSVIYAQSNAEKIELLRGIKEKKTKEEFDKMVDLMLEYKVISKEVYFNL